MATVFMKWLETNPKDYDRGIQIITLGQIQKVKKQISESYVHTGMHILEIGCGTGTLTTMMAAKGGIVTGIDASSSMLAEAEKKVARKEIKDQVTLRQMDASLIGDRFQEGSFDLIVATLVSSKLLAPGGKLLVADEVAPQLAATNFLYKLLRFPLLLLTWLLTRTTTAALSDFENALRNTGFYSRTAASYLGGSLVLYETQPAEEHIAEKQLPQEVAGRLYHRVTLRTVLLDLWLLFFRIIPPYPKVKTGLYAVGDPSPGSPVLVTGNFDLTVRRLVKAIDGRVDAWVLVADSNGINVWCGAGGGYFTAEKVIAAVKSSHLDKVVDHRALILPQLCANGVDGWRIRKETGWGVHWGPVKAEDIPAYLAAKGKKTDALRWVRFPLKDRLEMVTVTLGFYGLLILLPVLIFWRHMFLPIAASLLGLSYFYAIVHVWLPGRDGLSKSISLCVIALAGLFVTTFTWHPLAPLSLFHWSVGLTGLSIFTAAELQGMSPLMRGEQANWGYELIIGAVLVAIYWLVPLAFRLG
jgi:SAM-dependent methyltransferase